MKQYFGLLTTIAQKYNIKSGNCEDELSWKTRILYSFLAQTGYASLYDSTDDFKPISIAHFKNRIMETYDSLIAMYPELEKRYLSGNQSLANEIFDVYLSTGCIYHEPNRIIPCVKRITGNNSIAFCRGQSLNDKIFLSGMGCYIPLSSVNESVVQYRPIDEFFCFQQKQLHQTWISITEKAKFTTLSSAINLEYLRTVPPYSRGYWMNNPDFSGKVSLARTIGNGNRMYFLYKYFGDAIRISQLPDWMTFGYNYRNISVAYLAYNGTLPPTRFHKNGEIVELEISYLYPPSELNAIKLYSWPRSYAKFPSDFKRIMSSVVFEEFRKHFEHMGYLFEEV